TSSLSLEDLPPRLGARSVTSHESLVPTGSPRTSAGNCVSWSSLSTTASGKPTRILPASGKRTWPTILAQPTRRRAAMPPPDHRFVALSNLISRLPQAPASTARRRRLIGFHQVTE